MVRGARGGQNAKDYMRRDLSSWFSACMELAFGIAKRCDMSDNDFYFLPHLKFAPLT